eukprot:1186615-Prorocentrum_minimum.AAC.4
MASREAMREAFKQKQRERERAEGGRKILGRQQAAIAKSKQSEPVPTKPTTKRTHAELSSPSMAPPPPRAATGSAAESTSGVPADFFDSSSSKKPTAEPVVPVAVSAPKAAPVSKTVLPADFFSPAPSKPAAPAASDNNSALPVGFFDDKASDAKARGETFVPPNPEDEWAAFQKDVAGDLEVVEQLEAEEEAETAVENEERLEFEQQERLFLVENLKTQGQQLLAKKKEQAATTTKPKPKRGFYELELNEEDDNEEEDEIDTLDWRAKVV